MAGIRGKSSPPANQNAFKHGLAGIFQRRANGALNSTEHSIREEILAGLLADKSGEAQISTAMRVLAEIIASDVSLLVTFNQAIEGVIKNNQKARQNPKALIGRLQETAGGLVVGEPPAVRHGKSRQIGVASGYYPGDERRTLGRARIPTQIVQWHRQMAGMMDDQPSAKTIR